MAAPGIDLLVVGKGHGGYWRSPHMLVHTVNVIDAFDVLFGKYAHLYPQWYRGYECRARILLDWSSGHAAYKEAPSMRRP